MRRILKYDKKENIITAYVCLFIHTREIDTNKMKQQKVLDRT